MDDDYDNPAEEYESAIGKAIATWRNGDNIPLTLATELMEEGFNVPALEAQYKS